MLAKEIHAVRETWLKLVSAMEPSLAPDLMSDDEWAFHGRCTLAARAPNRRKSLRSRHVFGYSDKGVVSVIPMRKPASCASL